MAALSARSPSSTAHSHKYSVDSWTIEDGLPNHALYSVMYGPDGYLWLAGLAGAARFDGVRFTPILESLPNAHFKTLLLDRAGNVWVGMVGEGMARFRDGRVESFGPSKIGGSEVRALVEDTAGRIWAGTENGLSVIDGKGRIEAFRSGPVQALARGANGRIWIASSNGICLANQQPSQCLKTQAAALMEDQIGRLWAGTANGLFSMNSADLSPARPCAKGCFISHSVTALLESRRGEVWAGFDDGGVGTPDQEPYRVADGLKAGSVVSFAEDPEGSIWIASYNGGLERLRPKRVTMYTTGDGLPAKVVGSIVQDVSGSIWAGSQCGPVSRLEGERFVPKFAEYTKGACAISMLAARDGSIWIATDNGLFHWNGHMEHFDLSDTHVMALFESHDGTIWIGTLRGGLHNYVNGRLSRGFGPADGVASGEIENFAEDHEGRVWIGSNGKGLSVYENGHFRILPPKESPPEHDISGLFVDSSDDLWVETDRSGLYRRHNGRWEPFGPERGLNDRLVAGMLEDRAGNLWVSTASSISRIDRRNLEAASLDPIDLDRVDGMINPEVSGGGFDPTGLVDRTGRLWFSTIDGLAMIDPATFPVNRFAPPVVIESVASIGNTSGKTTAPAGIFQVAAGGPPVEIRYTGLSLIAPRKVRFRYRIRELSKEWEDAGHNRSVSYPHLPAGNYTFEVLAANSDGIWSQSPAVLSMEVAPFWWERISVRLLALAMLLAATGWGARFVAARRAAALLAELNRQEELTRERTRIARDIHDDLGARLTRMAWMAETGEKEEAGKLAAAAREAIQAMDELVWTVNTHNDTVDGFVSYAISYAEEYLRAVRIRVRVSSLLESPDAGLDGETRRHIFLTFKEALNNVVKHSGSSEVRLRFESDLNELRIRVTDNGKGFDMGRAATGGRGTGVNGMCERIAAIGGRCEVTSSEGSGASVYITVPLLRLATS